MLSARVLLVAGVALVLAVNVVADQPLSPPPGQITAVLPAGLWSIEFANGVIEASVVRPDGTASVLEEKRKADGKAMVQSGAVVIIFEDDRIERWTPVGRKMVVEHWFPASAFPAGSAVLGIGERMR
jgi:hypothetical protein